MLMPPMRRGTPGLNACESQPNPMRVSMLLPILLSIVITVRLSALAQVELGEGQIAGLRDLQINLRAGNNRNGEAGALDNGSFVGADEAVCRGLGKGALERSAAEALRGLGEDYEFARNGGGDERAVGRSFDLLDGVDGGKPNDGCSVFDDGVDGAVDGFGVDERANGVVDEDDVVFRAVERGQGVGYGFLAIFSPFDHVNAAGELEFCAVFGDLSFDALDLTGADGDVDGGDARDGGEGAQGVDEDGQSPQFEELLGLGGGHARAQAGGWKDDEYLHNQWSIHRLAAIL